MNSHVSNLTNSDDSTVERSWKYHSNDLEHSIISIKQFSKNSYKKGSYDGYSGYNELVNAKNIDQTMKKNFADDPFAIVNSDDNVPLSDRGKFYDGYQSDKTSLYDSLERPKIYDQSILPEYDNIEMIYSQYENQTMNKILADDPFSVVYNSGANGLVSFPNCDNFYDGYQSDKTSLYDSVKRPKIYPQCTLPEYDSIEKIYNQYEIEPNKSKIGKTTNRINYDRFSFESKHISKTYESIQITLDMPSFNHVQTNNMNIQVMKPVPHIIIPIKNDSHKMIYLKKAGIVLTFLSLNCIGISLIFLVPFGFYIWLLSISNAIRCVMIVSVLYKGFKNKFLSKGTSPNFNTFEKTVLMILPCFTESEEELKRSVDSIIEQKGNHKSVLVIIVDGENTGKGNALPTFEICEKLVQDENTKYECFSYWSWKEMHVEVRCKSGYVGETGVPYILMIKEKNMGKKDSLIIIRELILLFNGGKKRKLYELGQWFGSALFSFDLGYIHYISGIDADTIISENAIDLMVTRMISDDRLLGLSGNIRVDLNVNSPVNPWTAYQYFEYLYGQILTRSSQGVFGKITCLPGCIQIFSADPKLMDGPLDIFKELPSDGSLFDNVLSFLGEDRRFTCLMLYQNPLYRTDIVLGAYGTTAVPDSFAVFFSQRRRWFLSSQANNVLDVLSKQLPCIIRLMAAAQILASAITPFIFVAIVFAFIRLSISGSNRLYLLILGTSTPVWIFKVGIVFFGSVNFVEFAVLLYGIFVHTVFGAFVQTYNIMHALSTMDDLHWGLTRQVEKEPDTNL
jgi:chitin synthase